MSRADDGGRSCRNGSAPTPLYYGRSTWRSEPWWQSWRNSRPAEHRRRHHERGCRCFNPIFQITFLVDSVLRSYSEWEHVFFSPTICYLAPVHGGHVYPSARYCRWMKGPASVMAAMAANPDGRPPLFMVCGPHVWGSSVGHLEGRQLGQRGCEHQPSTGVARTQELSWA
jgi:hypothetical protein